VFEEIKKGSFASVVFAAAVGILKRLEDNYPGVW
jgi:hypothetical protein